MKWIKAAIPALLIHMSIGTVYCWSTTKEQIASQIGISQFAVGWAFSLAIFFLGMSAAFSGRFVERDIHKSSLLACICFSTGMIGTGVVIKFATGVPALLGIYLFYGIIMGVGLGVGYLTPVKTLMLWFSNQKGLATGISIMGFGLAKALATPIMELLQRNIGVSNMLIVLGIVYFVLMYIGHLLLEKPKDWIEPIIRSNDNILSIFCDKQFMGIWIMFFINIHCGLSIISYEKQILNTAFESFTMLPVIVAVVPSLTAACNALGRIGYSTLSDSFSQRNRIYKIIFGSSIVLSVVVYISGAITNAYNICLATIVVGFLFVINGGYGGGFSTLPALLSERFGMKKISSIHGVALSAWAIAGLSGNNMSELILHLTGSYQNIVFVNVILYIIAYEICSVVVGEKSVSS